MGRGAPVPGRASPSQMVLRGLIRHCPRCGGGHLFASWFRLHDRCPTCGMKFEREEGFWLGGYVINFGTGELAILILLAVLIGQEAGGGHINAWPYVAVGLFLAVAGPAITFPFSRTIWSAIDLVMRPLSDDEVRAAQAAVAASELPGGPLIPEGRPPPAPGDR